jgi:hypothetical protein
VHLISVSHPHLAPPPQTTLVRAARQPVEELSATSRSFLKIDPMVTQVWIACWSVRHTSTLTTSLITATYRHQGSQLTR